MASTLLILLGGIIGAGFLAGLVAEKTRVPDALLLILTGLLLGPAWEVVPTESLRPFMAPFGTIALIIILFEGGLDLDLKRTLRQSGRAVVLANGETIAGLFGARVRAQVVRRFGSATLDLHPRITESHAEVSFLTRSFFFVYLGLIFTWPGTDFRIWLTIALVAVAVVVAREVAVQLAGWTTRIAAADRSLLAAMLPRGLATAVLAAMLADQQPGTSVPWESLATFIIIITNLWMTFRLLKIRTTPAVAPEGKG